MKMLVLLSYMLLISVCLATGWENCYDTGNFTASSTYGINRNLLLSALASNVGETGGFYTTTIGQDSDKIYGLALCRGDVSLDDCGRCVNSTSEDIKTACPNQKEAFMWAESSVCIVRYAGSSFFGELELDVPNLRYYNENNITSNLIEFDQIWRPLMDNTAREASMGSSRLKFATQEANLTSTQTIYALMQCTPDLSQNDCYFCLHRYMAEYNNCCHGRQGGGVEAASCILRWDLYPFYRDIAVAPQPSPPPGLIKDNRGVAAGTVAIIVVSVIVFLILVAFTCFCLRRRKQKQMRSNQERRYSEFLEDFDKLIIKK